MSFPDRRVPSRSLRPLLVILAVVLAAFAFAFPRLRSMMEEARKLDAQTSANMAEAGKAAGLRLMASAARAEADRKPDDPDSQLRAAHAARQVGMMEQAERHAEIAAKLNPSNPEAWLILADLRRAVRNLQGAMDAYKSALLADPDNGPATGGLASLFITLGWRQDANVLLNSAVKKRPGDLPLKVALAMSCIQNNDYREAERLLLEVKAAAENDVRLWTPLINLFNLQKRYEAAVKAGRQILERTPAASGARNELGIALYRLNRTEEAEAEFNTVLKQDSANPTARYYLGLCFRSAGNGDAAIEQFEQVMTLSPGFEQTRQILGSLYIRRGRNAEGARLLAEFRAAQERGQRRARLTYRVANNPKDPAAHFELAEFYIADGDRQLAEVELNRTLELSPEHVESRRLLQEFKPPKPFISQTTP